MASIFIITPNSSLGIIASHQILTKELLKNFNSVYNKNSIYDFLKYIFDFKIFIFPVHYWYLGILCRLIGKKVIFICHGKPCKSHYKIIRFYSLVLLVKLSEYISSFSIYVSLSTKGKSSGYIFHNIDNNYHFEINNKFFSNNIIFFGRIDPSKGIRDIFRLVNKINRTNSKFNFLIAGCVTSSFHTEFEKLLTLHKFAVYLGEYKNNDELKLLLHGNSGIFLSLNFNEPFGIVYLEALKLGLLPIIPAGSGFSEVCDGLPIYHNYLDLENIIINSINIKNAYNININLNDQREELFLRISKLLGVNS